MTVVLDVMGEGVNPFAHSSAFGPTRGSTQKKYHLYLIDHFLILQGAGEDNF